jgi:PKD repeat protein
LTKIGPNSPLSGDFTFDPADPVAGEAVTFNAELTDDDGTVAELVWQFGAGQGDPVVTTASVIEHTYPAEGTYSVTLQAFDDSGGELVVTHDVTISEAPEDLCPDDPAKLVPGICGCGVADSDSDRDGIADCIDNCPAITNADQRNTDGDAMGDACDDDDDNDGMPDAWERGFIGLDPLVNDADGDLDRDGLTNHEEYLAGSDPAPRVVVGVLPGILLLLTE